MKKNNIFKKMICKIFLICFILINAGSIAFADSTATTSDDWWGDAWNWWQGGSTTVGIDSNMLSGIADIVEIIGTGVIAIVTVVLGMKYMLGSTNGKAEVKENIIGLVIACLFFFGWTNIRDILILGNSTGQNGISGSTTHLIFFQSSDLTQTFSRVFSLVLIVAQLVAVAVIVYNGVKFIFAGADAKAQLKEKSPLMIAGVILIFCTLTVLRFIVSIVTNI